MKVDVSFEFEVGESEKHLVDFTWGQWWGDARISVDGREVLRERHPFGLKTVKRYEVTVGESETHEVVIEKTRPLLVAGFRKQAFRAFVDDVQVGEY